MADSTTPRPLPSTSLHGYRGRPEDVEQYPIVEPFGDYQEEITRQVIEGETPQPAKGEPLCSWLKRRG